MRFDGNIETNKLFSDKKGNQLCIKKRWRIGFQFSLWWM